MGAVCGSQKDVQEDPIAKKAVDAGGKPAATAPTAAPTAATPAAATAAPTAVAAAPLTAAPAAVKVYGMAMSTCTRRVLATLEEKGVAYELVNIDLMKGEHKLPDFIAKQPFGVIPVLEHGDVQVFESRAIARYVATTWAGQGTDLLGADAKARAATDTWLEVEKSNYNSPVSTLVYERMFKAWKQEGPADEAVVTAETEKLNKVLDVYESILSSQPYLAGQEFSLADLSHLPYTAYLLASGITEPFQKHPAVQAWWDRISARPAWQKLTAA